MQPNDGRERDLGTVRSYFGILIGSGGFRVGFGFIPILDTLSVFETNDPPVVIAIRLCGVSDFE